MKQRRGGFTLVELLVVIGIIAVLIGILIPVISRVQRGARVADTKNFLIQLTGAIERYHSDFHAYPGPIHNNNIQDQGFVTPAYPAPQPVAAANAPGFDVTIDPKTITGSENLTLGLLGGLNLIPAGGGVSYNPSQVGMGPMNLNTANPKRYPAYMDGTNLS